MMLFCFLWGFQHLEAMSQVITFEDGMSVHHTRRSWSHPAGFHGLVLEENGCQVCLLDCVGPT